MATEGVLNVRTAGATIAQTNGNAQRAAVTAGEAKPRAKSAQPQARQVINVEGKSMNSHAPRGTYLNIVA
jgi:hypothetical protein